MSAVETTAVRDLYEGEPMLACGLADAARTVLRLEAALGTNLCNEYERRELERFDSAITELVRADEAA